MPRTHGHPSRHSARRALAGDAGFGMVEVLVSMVLLTVMALATLSIIDKSQAQSAFGRNRAVAADLAHDDLNRLRQLKFSLVSGQNYQSQQTSAPIDGVRYTITSTVDWATDSGVETSCTTPTTGGNSTYLHIASSVTWPGMGKAAPVVADSIMAPRGKEANRTAGSLMVKVQDRDGKAVSGATVTVAGQSLATSTAGCVFFPQINAGQWPVTVAKSGSPYDWVDVDGNSPGQSTASVVAGDVSTSSVSIDQPVIFKPVTFYRETDATTPITWTSLTATEQTKTVTYKSTTGMVTSLATGKLFPFVDGWSLYAGSCAGNDPTTWASNTSAAMPLANFTTPPTPRNQTVPTGRAYLRNVKVNFSNGRSGDPITVRVKAYTDNTYQQMAGCNEAYGPSTPPSPDASGNGSFSFDLPYGLYSMCFESGTPGSTRYRYYVYSSSNAPNGAMNVMPSMSGITLKAGSPVNDGGLGSFNATMTAGTSTTTDKCA
jgi:Tfp pilus assembly protein PilV